MKNITRSAVSLAMLLSSSAFGPAFAAEQDAIDGCIDKLREVGGPDGQSGTVLSSEYSEANTLVMLKDAGGTVWKCLAANDGTVAEMSMTQAADDGGGAAAGSSDGGNAATERVKFAAGTSSAQMDGGLKPGDSARYVLGAAKNQFLNISIDAQGEGITYQIFNPDGSFLLEQISAGKPYRGQLWQKGDHVVEVINRGNGNLSYTVTFSIE
jgi:hypothetical protein